MYTDCLFCRSGLGSNQEIEHLPVGRRVAFDPGRGRLWVVCPRCGRWNLCPFEERWEALEESERLARTSAVRASGEELSLLRHPSGLSLIRVGTPTLAELVSWRFARSLVWRRRGYYTLMAGLTAGSGLVLLGGAAGTAISVAISLYAFGKTFNDQQRPAFRLETSDGREIPVTPGAARGATFRTSEDGVVLDLDFTRRNSRGFRDPHTIAAPDIPQFLARAMPYVNEEGASERLALEAAGIIDARGGREAFLESVMADRELHSQAVFRKPLAKVHREGVLAKLPRPIRLAMEAASQVEQEERVLSGELEGVLAEWRRAEEIADIADRLIEPRGWAGFRARHNRRIEPQS